MTNDESEKINWPPRFEPGVAPIHVRNELDMTAQPENVFAWLIDAAGWPSWYPNAADVRFTDRGVEKLQPGARFRWKTFGVSIVSRIAEFKHNERIAWDGRAIGVDVYHAWLIIPSRRGAHVITEETQYGVFARTAAALWPSRMHRFHQIWLENLAEKAASGLPSAR
ncbi:MAG: SRPBCC family protein [Parvularculaceae bacterium]